MAKKSSRSFLALACVLFLLFSLFYKTQSLEVMEESQGADYSAQTESVDIPDTIPFDQKLLAQVEIQPSPPPHPQQPYSRKAFGQRWKDVDRNGCDTRNDILARDLQNVERKPGTCRVLSGTLEDPYSGKRIEFRRGQGTSELVQIDHLVPLADAWQKGASAWTPERREEFANDPLNLMAVDGELNQQKSAADAGSWLPPQESFRCTYIRKQLAVKAKYSLYVSQREHQVMSELLSSAFCSNSR